MQKNRQPRRTDGVHAGGRPPLYKQKQMTEAAFFTDLLDRYKYSTQTELAEYYRVSRQTICKYLKQAKEMSKIH